MTIVQHRIDVDIHKDIEDEVYFEINVRILLTDIQRCEWRDDDITVGPGK